MTVLGRLVAVVALWSALFAFALPTYVQDEYEPDLITAVNQDSSGGHYYLRSTTLKGLEGDAIVRNASWDGQAFKKEHEDFAPHFFIRDGDLYSMTNSTHLLRVGVMNITDSDVKHIIDDYNYGAAGGGGETQQQARFTVSTKERYKLKLVEPLKHDSNVGHGEGKYLAGSWSWQGPILLYAFQGVPKGVLFYSCDDGVYAGAHVGPPPPFGCEIVTLHARNILLSWR